MFCRKKTKGIKRAFASVILIGTFFCCTFVNNYINLTTEVYADTSFTQFTYEILSDKDVKILECTDLKAAEIEIPEKLGERRVTAIGGNAFANCKNLTSIHIPEWVENIEEGALSCPKLNNITVDDNNIYFRTVDGVLVDKDAKTLLQYPPGKLDEDGNPITIYRVHGDDTTDIKIIGKAAFKDAKGLTDIIFETEIEKINDSAFENCTSLFYAYIPKTVTVIGDNAFKNCTAMKELFLGEMVPDPTKTMQPIPTSPPTPVPTPTPTPTPVPDPTSTPHGITDPPIIVPTPTPTPTPVPTPTITYKLTSDLISIGEHAFDNCISVPMVQIPASCQEIGQYAFYGCKGLWDLRFDYVEGGTLNVGPYAFANCTNSKFTLIVLPESITKISDYMFYGTGGKGLAIYLPKYADTIGQYAFSASKIKKITIPQYVKELPTGTFQNCGELEEVEQYFVGSDENPDDAGAGRMEKIGDFVFDGCKSLHSITFPRLIKTFGKRSFAGTKLSKIDLPLTLTSVPEECFSGCKQLAEMFIPKTVKEIEDRAFMGCTALKEVEVEGDKTPGAEVHAELEKIGDEAFSGCTALTKFVFGNEYDVDNIRTFSEVGEDGEIKIKGVRAFYNCKYLKNAIISKIMSDIPDEMYFGSGLTEVTIPNNIRSVGERAFANCAELKWIDLESPDANDSVILPLTLGKGSFSGCKKLAEVKNFSIGISTIPEQCFYQSGLTSLVIPGNIGTIKDEAFSGSASLKTLKLENGVKSIGVKSFYGCKALEKMEISDFSNKMTEIPVSAFEGSGIKKLEIPAYIETLGENAFTKCTLLTSVTFENAASGTNNPKTVGKNCFAGDSAIVEVDLGNTVEFVEEGAFSGLSKLERFTFSPKMSTIEANTFNKSFSAASTAPPIVIPSNIKEIKTSAFASSGVPSVVMEDGGVTLLGDTVFTSSKIQSIKLPDSINQIPAKTFSGSSLKTITIPGNVEIIGDSAFEGCKLLEDAAIEEGVKTLGKAAFKGCAALKTISSGIPSTITAIPESAFATAGLVKIEIPATVTAIDAQAFSTCNLLKDIIMEDGSEPLTMGKSVFEKCKVLENITFPTNPDRMKAIPDSTFNSSGIKEIKIPSNIETIGSQAFAKCQSLAKAELEEGVKNIGNSAFDGCKQLAELTLPRSVETIGEKAFNQNSSLQTLDIPGAAEIGASAFASNTSLTNVKMNDGTKKIGASAFSGCKALQKVEYPSTLETIGEKAFNACAAMEEPELPDRLQEIGASAFAGCTGIRKLLMPKNLKSVGKSAFSKCSELENVTFAGNAPTIFDDSVFTGAHSGIRLYHYTGTTGYTHPRWNNYLCEEINIVEMEMVSRPDRLTYKYGERKDLDRTGMKIVIKYSNGMEVDVTNDVIIEGFNGSPAQLGEQKITISYPNIEQIFELIVTITETKLTGIVIEKPPTMTDYLQGDELNLDGMVIKGQYDNGQTETILPSDCQMINYFKDVPGKQVVTVRYTAKLANGTQRIFEATFEVNVRARTLTGIIAEPDKLRDIYSQGSSFDPKRVKVTAVYDNGDNVVLTPNEYNVLNFDTTNIGENLSYVIEYKGESFTLYFDVVETLPSKLNVKNYRTEYIESQRFAEGDAVVEIVYDNGTSHIVPYGEYDVDFNLTRPPYKCTISYKGLSYEYGLTVVEKMLSDIRITEPTKHSYAIGEKFDRTGLVVTAVYDNGYEEEVTNYTIDGFNSSVSGLHTVAVIYQNKYKEFEIYVEEKQLVDIDVMYKKTYSQGESFARNLTYVYAVYSDTSRERVEGFNVDGFSSAAAGEIYITVSYSGISKSLPVTIVSGSTASSIIGISVETVKFDPYILGNNYFDHSSVIVTAQYGNGDSTILSSDEYDVIGMDNLTPGRNLITISYLGFEATTSIIVENKTLINVEVVSYPTKRLYNKGEAIDPTGLSVKALFSDGTERDVTSSCQVYANTSMVGTQVARVVYEKVTNTYEITVSDTIDVTSITVMDYTRSYMQGAPFDNKLTVYASFSDGKVEKISAGYNVTGFNSSAAGANRVTVEYMGKTASFDVIIIPISTVANILGINVEVTGSVEYVLNSQSFDRSSIVVRAIMSDGTEEIINDYSVSGFETAVAGAKTLTISYLNFTKNISIMVSDKQIMGIALLSKPTRLTYTEGTALNTEGLGVLAFYSDGSSAVVTGQVVVSGYDTNKVGTQTITVTYIGKTATFEVTVEPSLSSTCMLKLNDARINKSKVKAKISAQNNTDSFIMGTLVVSIYEKGADGKEGKMIGMHTEGVILMVGDNSFEPTFAVSDSDADDFIVTAYLWKDVLSMIPISEKSSLEI